MTTEKVVRWGYGDDRHRLQTNVRCTFVRVVQMGGGGPQRGGTNEAGHDDSAMATKSKCPPRRVTCKIRYMGLGQVVPICEKRSHSAICVEGPTNVSLVLSCYAKRAPAARSLELAWQPWDAKTRRGLRVTFSNGRLRTAPPKWPRDLRCLPLHETVQG